MTASFNRGIFLIFLAMTEHKSLVVGSGRSDMTSETKILSLEEVSKHDTKTDCWLRKEYLLRCSKQVEAYMGENRRSEDGTLLYHPRYCMHFIFHWLGHTKVCHLFVIFSILQGFAEKLISRLQTVENSSRMLDLASPWYRDSARFYRNMMLKRKLEDIYT